MDMEQDSASTSSRTLSLLERINKALGKGTEPSSVPTYELLSDTESDNDSSDGNNFKIGSSSVKSAKNNELMDVSPTSTTSYANHNLVEPSSKLKSVDGTAIRSNFSSHDFQTDSSSASCSFANKDGGRKVLSGISTFDDDMLDFPMLSSRREKYKNIFTDFDVGKISSTATNKNDAPSLTNYDVDQNFTETRTNKKTKSKEEKDIEREQKRKAIEMEKSTKQTAKLEEKRRKLEEAGSKKKLQELEKAEKKAASMTAKAESIDQCLQYITVVLDSNLLNDGGGQILQFLDRLGAQYEIKKLPVPSTAGWMRDHVEYGVDDNCQIKRKSDFQEEIQILMRFKAAEFASMVEAEKLVGSSTQSSSSVTLLQCMNDAEQLLPNKQITIIVTGMESHMKMLKAKNTLKKKKQASSSSEPNITQDDVEHCLFKLQFELNCCIHFCESADDLAQMVAMFTKSVAEKPYKKTPGTAFNIYMNNHDKNLPKVTKDGQGLLEVWVKQLQQFKGVGHDTAAAIVHQYPSPCILMQAYDNCSTEQEGRLLLQDIEVRRGHGVLATSRRVGPELSKKIYVLFTSLDGDIPLAKS